MYTRCASWSTALCGRPQARQWLNERRQRFEETTGGERLALPAGRGGASQARRLDVALAYLAFERGNYQRLEHAVYTARVVRDQPSTRPAISFQGLNRRSLWLDLGFQQGVWLWRIPDDLTDCRLTAGGLLAQLRRVVMPIRFVTAAQATAYDHVLMEAMHYPDVWYDYASWHLEGGGGGSAPALAVLHRGRRVRAAVPALQDSYPLAACGSL